MKAILTFAIAALVLSFGANAASAADFSGKWKIEFSVNNTPATVDCTLDQSGNSLSGQCIPVMDKATASDLMGAVDGSSAKWGYDVVFNGNPGHVGYEAKMTSPTTMSGTLMLSGNPSPFKAEKQ